MTVSWPPQVRNNLLVYFGSFYILWDQIKYGIHGSVFYRLKTLDFRKIKPSEIASLRRKETEVGYVIEHLSFLKQMGWRWQVVWLSTACIWLKLTGKVPFMWAESSWRYTGSCSIKFEYFQLWGAACRCLQPQKHHASSLSYKVVWLLSDQRLLCGITRRMYKEASPLSFEPAVFLGIFTYSFCKILCVSGFKRQKMRVKKDASRGGRVVELFCLYGHYTHLLW